MTRNVFGWHYPPGAENDPNAPWNQKEIISDCLSCGESKNSEDMSDREIESYNDRDDGLFLCDDCFTKEWEG